VGVGERIFADANLTYSQYRALHSILIDALGFALLPKEADIRRENKKRDSKVPIIFGDAKMEDGKGALVDSSFWHTASVVGVVERDVSDEGWDTFVDFIVPSSSPINLEKLQGTKRFDGPDIAEVKKQGAYFQHGSKKEWESETAKEPSPLVHPLADSLNIKSLGDKGGGSFKEGGSVLNRRDPNSARNFTLVAEFSNCPDNSNNLACVFEQIGPELAFLQRSSLVLLKGKDKTAAKIIPGLMRLKKEDLAVIDFGDVSEALPVAEVLGPIINWPKPSGSSKLGVIVGSIEGTRVAVGVGYFAENDASPESLEAGWYRFNEHVELDDSGSFKIRVMPNRVFKSGDYDYLTTLVGHQGAAATYPCIWCYAHKDEIDKGAGPFDPRLLASFKTNFEAFKGDTRKEAGKHHMSVTKPTISDIEPSQTAPLILHNFLGEWCGGL
jgi:hypothetical protein